LIKLIRNELTKQFKKKFLLVMAIIAICFSLTTNLLNKKYAYPSPTIEDINMMIGWYEEDYKYYENNKIIKDDTIYYENSTMVNDDTTYVASITASLKRYQLVLNYDLDSWQSYVILNHQTFYNIMEQIAIYELGAQAQNPQDGIMEALQYNKDELERLIKLLDKNDWRYFVETELREIQNDGSAYSKANKQTLEWRLEYDIAYGYNYQNHILANYAYNYEMAKDYENMSDKEKEKMDYEQKKYIYQAIEETNKIEYDIKNQTNYFDDYSPTNIVIDAASTYMVLLIVIAVVVAGTIVAEEFNKGTIKLLLIRPFSRLKIITSKFIAAIAILLASIVVLYVIQFFIAGIIWGFKNYSLTTIVFNFNTMSLATTNIFGVLIMNLLALMPQFILMLSLAFALGTLFNNSAIAIGVSLLGLFASEIINQFTLMLNIQWLKYFVTINWNLTPCLNGGLPLLKGLNIGFSLLICLIYFLIMIITSFIVFKKRNIKNI